MKSRMLHGQLIKVVLFFYGLNPLFLHAQTSVIPTGGNGSGSGGSVSYTIGQVAYSTLYGADGSLLEGVQHPYEISVATSLDEASLIELTVTVYPNPASNHIAITLPSEFLKGENIVISLE